MLWRCCWLGGRKGIRLRPVKNWAWGAGIVICLEWGADLCIAQLMPLPLTVSCFSKIQIGLPFWYRLTRIVPEKGPLNLCVYVCAYCWVVIINLQYMINFGSLIVLTSLTVNRWKLSPKPVLEILAFWQKTRCRTFYWYLCLIVTWHCC